jgi:hypothetical protein
MDLLHESSEEGGGVVLVNRLVKGDKRVLDGARAFGGEQGVDGALPGGETVIFDFLEGSDIRLGSPDRRLRNRDALGGENSGQQDRKTEQDSQARSEHHEETSSRKFSEMSETIQNLQFQGANELLMRACSDVKRGDGIVASTRLRLDVLLRQALDLGPAYKFI